MKKITFPLFAILLSIAIFGCSKPMGYKINGVIKDVSYNGKTVYLEDPFNDTATKDSVTVKDGKFCFSDSLDVTTPYVRILSLPSLASRFAYRLPVVIENGTINSELGDIVCTSGTELNDRLQDFLLGIDEFLSSIHKNKNINAEEIKVQFSDFLQKAIATNADNAVGVYIYKMYLSSLYPEHRDALLGKYQWLKEQVKK